MGLPSNQYSEQLKEITGGCNELDLAISGLFEAYETNAPPEVLYDLWDKLCIVDRKLQRKVQSLKDSTINEMKNAFREGFHSGAQYAGQDPLRFKLR